MAKFHTELNDELKQFIAAQQVFFNAWASYEGRINVSPKGLDTFCILSDKLVAYLDLTGSENETAAHVKMGEERLAEYRHERNLAGIDGLPTYLEEPPPM
jgi:hypothetical protein